MPAERGRQSTGETSFKTAFIELSSQALGNLGALLNPALAPYFAQMGLFNLESPPSIAGFNEPAIRSMSIRISILSISRRIAFLASTSNRTCRARLDVTFVGGYDHPSNFSQESYTNAPGFSLDTPQGIQKLETAVGTLKALLGPAFAPYAPYFAGIGQGELPESEIKQLGIVSGDYNLTKICTPYDQSDFGETQWSGELRLNASSSGRLNFMFGGYSLHANNTSDYYVASPMLDYPSIILGSFLGPLHNPTQCAGGGCVQSPPFYHNQGRRDARIQRGVRRSLLQRNPELAEIHCRSALHGRYEVRSGPHLYSSPFRRRSDRRI